MYYLVNIAVRIVRWQKDVAVKRADLGGEICAGKYCSRLNAEVLWRHEIQRQ